jgi:hypothetical protein
MTKPLARPIKTKRDFHGARSATHKTGQNGQEPEAERRLQALLHEIEKFDDTQDEDDAFDDNAEDVENLPRRRWSDEASDAE